MSIITEALRKAQSNRFRESEVVSREKEISSIAEIYRIPDKDKGKINRKETKFSGSLLLISVLFFIIVIIAGGLIVFRILNPGMEQKKVSIRPAEYTKDVNIVRSSTNPQYDVVVAVPKKKNHLIAPVKKIESRRIPLPVLNGIMFSAEHPTAILNDTMVAPGDKVFGFNVIKISPSSVELSDNGNTYSLKLK